MSLNIVHFSVTPMAGGPYRLVNCLRRNTVHNVRLIDIKRWNIYPHDLVFSENMEACVELTHKADIIHFHNYLDLSSKFFEPINFEHLAAKGTRFLRHFRSEPGTVASIMKLSVKDVLNCKIPSVAIAQYPERFYPNAMVVPNNLPIAEERYMPASVQTEWDLFFSPTKKNSAWADRWNTKGAPETIQMMKGLSQHTGCTTKVVSGKPLTEVLHEKQRSYIVLDDMVTGSYHISALEGVSMAKPTICYLDERTIRVLHEVTGSDCEPFINSRLEEAPLIIDHLLQDKPLGEDIGKEGRRWLEKNWSEPVIASKFDEIYGMLLQNPSLIKRQEALRLDSPSRKFFAITKPDIVHQCRKLGI